MTPKEILELIRKLPEAEHHVCICPINKKPMVTNEWLCGGFAGRGFDGDTFEEAAQQLIDYLYEHIGHDSIVGNEVTKSGFPDLDRVYQYCLDQLPEEE